MRRACALLLVLINLCVINATAEKHRRVTVPFDFDVNGQLFPAGAYDVSFDIATWEIALTNCRDGSKHSQWLAVPSGLDEGFDEPHMKLSFDKAGNNYKLASITVDKWEAPARVHSHSKALSAQASAGAP
jgi:hypothetical protein